MCGALRIYFSLTRGLVNIFFASTVYLFTVSNLHINVLLLGQNVEKLFS